MLGWNLGMVVEISVAILLAVTIGYCVLLNARLKRPPATPVIPRNSGDQAALSLLDRRRNNA